MDLIQLPATSRGLRCSILGVLAFLSVACSGETTSDSVALPPVPTPTVFDGPFERLHIGNDTPLNGIYDPSVDYSSDGSIGYLAYTAVFGGMTALEIRIAKTTDNGRTWNYASTANPSFPGSFTVGANTYSGDWVYEVATIVNDPTDPGKEWKLYAHKYFHYSPTPGQRSVRVPQSFSIVYFSTSNPEGAWSTERILFGAGPNPRAPENKEIDLNSLHSSLNSVNAYTEPGAYEKQGSLFMNLTALFGNGDVRTLILLKSTDHGESWTYQGDISTNQQARLLGDTSLDGAAIFELGGKEYLLATPSWSDSNPVFQFNGTYVLEFEDFETARLRKDSEGKFLVHIYIKPQDFDTGNHGAGQATYHRFNTGGGVLVPQINLEADQVPERAQIFKTNIIIDL